MLLILVSGTVIGVSLYSLLLDWRASRWRAEQRRQWRAEDAERVAAGLSPLSGEGGF